MIAVTQLFNSIHMVLSSIAGVVLSSLTIILDFLAQTDDTVTYSAFHPTKTSQKIMDLTIVSYSQRTALAE